MAKSGEPKKRKKTAAVETDHKPKRATGPVALLIATRKGAFILRGGKNRGKWKLSEPIFLGHMVHHMVQDPRDRRTILMACRTGHLGPTVFRSTDLGKTWTEAQTPPAFPKAPEGEKGLVVDHVFWLTSGHESEPGVWYAGSSPQGLFRSEDGGATWEGITGFNNHPMRDVLDWRSRRRNAGRPQDAFDTDRPARSHSYVSGHVGRRRV